MNRNKQLIKDLKRAKYVLVFAEDSNSFYKTTKKEVRSNADQREIKYYTTREEGIVIT